MFPFASVERQLEQKLNPVYNNFTKHLIFFLHISFNIQLLIFCFSLRIIDYFGFLGFREWTEKIFLNTPNET